MTRGGVRWHQMLSGDVWVNQCHQWSEPVLADTGRVLLAPTTVRRTCAVPHRSMFPCAPSVPSLPRSVPSAIAPAEKTFPAVSVAATRRAPGAGRGRPGPVLQTGLRGSNGTRAGCCTMPNRWRRATDAGHWSAWELLVLTDSLSFLLGRTAERARGAGSGRVFRIRQTSAVSRCRNNPTYTHHGCSHFGNGPLATGRRQW